MKLTDGIDAIVEKYNTWKARGTETYPLFNISIGSGSGLKLDPLGVAISILYRKSPSNELDIMTYDKFDPKSGHFPIREEYDMFTLAIDGSSEPPLQAQSLSLYEKCEDRWGLPRGYKTANEYHYNESQQYLNYGTQEDDNSTYGVSVHDNVPTNISNKQLFENWKAVRESGTLDFAKTCEPTADYPFLKLKPVLNDVVEKNGAIIIHNDAWWEHKSNDGVYYDNMYMENMGELANIIWSLPSRQNVWFIYRTPSNNRILTPWDEGMYGPRAFCLGYGDGRVASADKTFKPFDHCIPDRRPKCEMNARIGLKQEGEFFVSNDNRERRRFIAAGGRRRSRRGRARKYRGTKKAYRLATNKFIK